MIGVPHAAAKHDRDGVKDGFLRATRVGGSYDLKFNIDFGGFSTSRASTSWLRSAYLAWFALLGYRFVYRPELDVVRGRIAAPDSANQFPCRMVRPHPVPEPTLFGIEAPEIFRSFAMLYDRNVVFLPLYGDHELYSRLAIHPEGEVNLSGTTYPWPDRPLFYHDK